MPTITSAQAKYSQPEVVDFWTKLARHGLQCCEIEMVRRYLPPTGHILDVGCGAGRAVVALGEAGYNVTGIDLSLAMLSAGLQQTPESRLGSGNIMALPFADDTFDAVLMFFGALQHVRGRRNRQRSISEMRRVVRSGGRVIMGLDNIAPGLPCYAYWLQRKWRNRTRSVPGNGSAQSTAADSLLWEPRTHPLLWHSRGLYRTLRWRTWPALVDLVLGTAPLVGLSANDKDPGDVQLAQFSVPPTQHTVFYHVYRAHELIDDAKAAGLSLVAFHCGAGLNDGEIYPEQVRGQDKQLLFAFQK